MTNVIFIFGTHGAGKSTCVKKLLDNYEEKICEFGKFCINIDKKIVAPGSYKPKCGGLDCFNSMSEYFNILSYLIKNYPDYLILAEGIIISGAFKTPIYELQKFVIDYKINILLIYLEISTNESYKRVFKRSLKKPNIKTIINKNKQIQNNILKYIKSKLFPVLIINVNNKNEQQVTNTIKDYLIKNKIID